MKRNNIREKIRYLFDCLMSKGPLAMIALLLVITMTLVGLIGLAAWYVHDEGSALYHIWNSFLHTLDPGTISGNETNNIPYLVMMTLATLCGLFLTSVLIGIITSGVEGKLHDLSKGISVVQEKEHVVILGFNENLITLLQELIEANENHKNRCVVVLGEQEKEEMEQLIASRIKNTKTTRIICRTGSLHEDYSFERCNVEHCRSVIINLEDDANTIKSILALTAYVRQHEEVSRDVYFIASIQDRQNLEAARIAGEGRAEIVYAKDAISRIIAHTCRQHGLSQVVTEILNFYGNEMYLEDVPALTGKTFREAALMFSNAIPVGLQLEGQVILNPEGDTVIRSGDRVVLLEKDDGEYTFCQPPRVDEQVLVAGYHAARHEKDHLVVLGTNDKLPLILQEYSRYVRPDTQVTVVDDDVSEECFADCGGMKISLCRERPGREMLRRLLSGDVNNILLLNDSSTDAETSDARTLLNLILLRDIADQEQRHFAITTEMRNPENQRLATRARVDDFVIGSNFISLLMVQISENKKMLPLIDELLNDEGAEFYMKPAAEYVTPGVQVDGFALAESAARKGEVYVGYRIMSPQPQPVVVNPDKTVPMVLGQEDLIVVIAEN